MIDIKGYDSLYSQYEAGTKKTKGMGKAKETGKTSDNTEVKSSEQKLSQKAADYLAELRKKYGDYDFAVADDEDDYQGIVKQSSKEYTIIYSSAELEKMASDEKYAEEKMQQVETIVNMTKKICEDEGFSSIFGQDGNQDSVVKTIGVSVGDDGSMKIFAELEKISEKQRERIEKAKEKQAEEKKESEKTENERIIKKNPYEKDLKPLVKRTTVEASTTDELLEKIKAVDWSKIGEQENRVGDRFDYSV